MARTGLALVVVAATLVGFLLAPADQALAAAPDAITTVDSNGYDVGWSTSIVLDAAGNPVVSYVASGGEVRVAHCGNASCTAGNAIYIVGGSAPDRGTSLALDDAGYPVVAYGGGLVHCGDANCSSGNVHATATIGEDSVGLILDSSGNPVVASLVSPFTSPDLRLLRCNDPACIGGDDADSSIGSAAPYGGTSLAMDGAGNPVLSFQSTGLTVVHCNDANCAGGNESYSSPDIPDSGRRSSLELDAAGNPVVAHSYYNTLKLLHCNDPNCDGGDESITGPAGGYPDFTSLELSAAGYPVVSYADLSTSVLMVLVCDDPDCDGTGEVRTAVDTPDNVGVFTSLALDATGAPVVSYNDFYNGDLKVAHCTTPTCDGDGDDDGCSNSAEQQTAPGSELTGGRRNYKSRFDYFNPTGDGLNRIDDVLAVVDAYFMDDSDENPGLPPYAASYNPNTDRTLVGPDPWDSGNSDGLQRIDDVLNQLKQYFHDCA